AGFVVVNDRYRDGIGSSIATAALSLRHVADAMLLLLADQVLITPQHIEALLAAWTGSDTHIVATAFGEDSGPPVLLPRGTFGLLSELAGDRGAKALFSDSAFEFSTLRFDDAGYDIDTPGDLKHIVQRTDQA
ncbi:MAG: NTP transferase domain-containing protein, partial [Gammaproteobacteria bacterium]|nr:NTP transferase domain-containing protein [Gammaproteobacteria bacterium]